MTVHEYFYSRNLLQFTKELVYIPYFETDDPVSFEDKISFALSTLIEQPAVIYADKIVLKTRKVRDLYLKKLDDLSYGKNKDYWHQKIILEEEFQIM